MRTRVQVYGRFDGYWSHAGVSRGIVEGLIANGIETHVYNISSGPYEDMPQGAIVSYDRVSPIGIYVGGYPPMSRHWLEPHEYKIGMFIAESETIPEDWAYLANKCNLTCYPSQWCKEVYRRAGVPARKQMVVKHGVYLAFCPRDDRLNTIPTFLHLCGSASFPERKGTPNLIQAFCEEVRSDEARLLVKVPPGTPFRDVCQVTVHENINAVSPDMIQSLMYASDVIIQPSRAEAFGIVPLEARLMGKPVIITHCTGHKEHAEPTDIIVCDGNHGPIEVNGIPNGTAPEVTVEAIKRAIREYLNGREVWHNFARVLSRKYGYANSWRWQTVTRGFSDRIKKAFKVLSSGRSLDSKFGIN